MARLKAATVTVKLRVRVQFSPDDLDAQELSGADLNEYARRVVRGEFNGLTQGNYTIEDGALHEMQLLDDGGNF